MLAAADVGTVTVFSLGLGVLVSGGALNVFWAEALLPAWIVLAKLCGLYDRDHRTLRHLTADELPSIFVWLVTGSGLTVLVVPGLTGRDFQSGGFLQVFAIALVAAVSFRAAARFAWRRLVPPDRTVIIGEGPLAEAARRKLHLFPEIHAEPVGALAMASALEVEERLGELKQLTPHRLLLASSAFEDDLLAALIGYCRREAVKLSVVPPNQGQLGTAVRLGSVAELPVLEYNTADVSRSTILLKRLIDVVLAAVLLVLLAPLLALAALAILAEDGRPIFFKQVRAGVGGRPFTMWKFRTMLRDAEQMLRDLVSFDRLEEPVFKLRDDPRVTHVGRIIRRFRLDELPQLFNFIRGDMSLVGPRPEQADLVAMYGPEHHIRLNVKPGVTGPMQVFGRGELSLEERIAVERDYIENLSVGRDLRILAMTVAPVITGRGAY